MKYLILLTCVSLTGSTIIIPDNADERDYTVFKSNNWYLLAEQQARGERDSPVEETANNRKKRDVTVNYSDDEIQDAIDKHNYYRRQQGSSDMLYMVTFYHKIILQQIQKFKTTLHESVC